MAHTAHQEHVSQENKPKTALSSAFWLVIILGGLLIAAFNFVRVMSADDEGHGGGHGGHQVEQTTKHGEAAHEAPHHQEPAH